MEVLGVLSTLLNSGKICPVAMEDSLAAHRQVRHFKNREALSEDYVPAKLIGRESQLATLYHEAAMMLDGGRTSAFVYGSMGQGKSVASRMVEKAATNEGVQTTFINASEVPSSIRLLNKITESLAGGHLNYRDGIQTEQLDEALENSKSPPLIIIDECHEVKLPNQAFYILAERKAQYGVGLIMISKYANFLKTLDPSTESRLSPVKVMFEPYSPALLQVILAARAEEGLNKEVNRAVIHLIAAEVGMTTGDARKAIGILGHAATLAEMEASEEITEAHAHRAIDIVEASELLREVLAAPWHARVMALAIATFGDKNPPQGVAYRKYVELCNGAGWEPRSYRCMASIVNQNRDKFITAERGSFPAGSHGGQTTRLSVQNPKAIMDAYDEIMKFTEGE